jgi:hypothetical protein
MTEKFKKWGKDHDVDLSDFNFTSHAIDWHNKSVGDSLRRHKTKIGQLYFYLKPHLSRSWCGFFEYEKSDPAIKRGRSKHSKGWNPFETHLHCIMAWFIRQNKIQWSYS